MTLFEIVQASTLFVLIIVLVVLAGVLITEIFKRKRREEIFYFILILFGVVAKIVIDTYWDFKGLSHLILGIPSLSLDFILLASILIVFYKLRKKIDKNLILLIIISAIILIFTSFSLFSLTPLINIFPSKFSLFLLGSVVGLLQTILVITILMSSYFLVIKFLVDNSRRKK